jgi:hypothetical protein
MDASTEAMENKEVVKRVFQTIPLRKGASLCVLCVVCCVCVVCVLCV